MDEALAVEMIGGLEPGEFAESGVEIEQADGLGSDGICQGSAWRKESHGHMRGAFPELPFVPHLLLAEIPTVIAGEADDGVVRGGAGFKRGE